MSSGTLLILLLVGVPLVMMFMHRGGHAGGGMGGCCGGHSHGDNTAEKPKLPSDNDEIDDSSSASDVAKPSGGA